MRPRIIVAALVAVGVVFAAGAPPALAVFSGKKAIWGPVSDFRIYHDLGVGIYQMGLNWATVAPSRPLHPRDPQDPAYHWTGEIDYAIHQATRYHMRILLQVSRTPPWANGGKGKNYPPQRPGDLRDFVAAAARRYPSVRLWMIWGEPNRKPNFATLVRAPRDHRLTSAQAAAPHLYAQMLDASYGALKGVSRRNLVIGGNTYTAGDISTRQWIENLRLPDGRRPRMDLYGHNPFSFRGPNFANPPSSYGEVDFSDLARLSALVDRDLARPHQQIKLFLSEWTIPTSPRDNEFPYYTTLAVQARWITDAWRIVRSSSFIFALGWIHLFDDRPGRPGTRGGLIFSGGQRKPGYYAFKAG